jgi:FkbM family methyltransferase
MTQVAATARPACEPAEPAARERLAARALRLWPFLSGCGRLAASGPARALLPTAPRVVWARVRGARIAVPLDDLVGRAIFLAGDLDRKVTWVLDRLLGPGDTVVDVGANLGLVSLIAAQRVGPRGRVLAIEPSPAVLPLLGRSLAANPGLRIELFPVAAGAAPGRLRLLVPPGNAGGASLAVPHEDARPHEVEVRRLADILAAAGVERVDLLKLDVEGFEAEALRGLFDDGAAPLPRVVLYEDNGARPSGAGPLLAARGYRLWGLPRAWLRLCPLAQDAPGFAACGDVVAIREGPAGARARAALGLEPAPRTARG